MSRPMPEWLAPARWMARPQPLLLGASAVWDGTQPHADLAAACAAHRGRRVRLWLSSAVLVETPCPDGLPIADDAAALDWARGLLLHYHGEAAAGWPLAAWQGGRRRGVSAWRTPSLDAVRATARAAGVHLADVRPWWPAVLRQALRRAPALRRGPARLLLAEGAWLTAVDLDDGDADAVQVRRLAAADGAALRDWQAAQPARPTVTVGYGLAGWHGDDGAQALDAAALARSAPDAAWLNPAGT